MKIQTIRIIIIIEEIKTTFHDQLFRDSKSTIRDQSLNDSQSIIHDQSLNDLQSRTFGETFGELQSVSPESVPLEDDINMADDMLNIFASYLPTSIFNCKNRLEPTPIMEALKWKNDSIIPFR